jgi:hypothetical protein
MILESVVVATVIGTDQGRGHHHHPGGRRGTQGSEVTGVMKDEDDISKCVYGVGAFLLTKYVLTQNHG